MDAGASAPPRRRNLDQDVILDAAVRLIDERGLDGLTMRNLGRELGVDPMAVYKHFEDKATLFEAVVDRETARLATVPGPLPDDPADVIVHVWVHYRAMLLEHPNLAPLVANRPMPATIHCDGTDIDITTFRAVGVAEDDIPFVVTTLVRFALGFVVREAAEVARWGQVEAERAKLVDEWWGPESAPQLGQRTVARALDPSAAARDYEMGLRALLHGLGTHRDRLPL